MTPRVSDRSRPDVLRSNSTAHIFLGGARKSWMSDAAAYSNSKSNNSTSPSRPATARPASLSSSSAPSASVPPPPPSDFLSGETPPVPAVFSSPAPAWAPGMRVSSSHLHENLASCTNNNNNNHISFAFSTTSTTSPAPAPATIQNAPPPYPEMSPVSHTPTPPSAPRPLPPMRPEQRSRPAESQQQPQEPRQLEQKRQQWRLQQQSAASLPSPDPTIPPRSHTSPPNAIERNEPAISSASAIAFPSPPHPQTPPIQQRPRQIASSVGALTVSSLGNHQQGVGASNPLRPTHRGNAEHGPYTPPFRSHPTPPAAFPATAPTAPLQGTVVVPPLQLNGRDPVINDEFFTRARFALDSFSQVARTSMLLSETVEAPRIQLLMNACVERDLIYLATHQVYCLSSYAPSEFIRLPGITSKHSQGLDTLRNLLVDNHRVSGDFLRWSVHFPYPVSVLLRVPMYVRALSHVRRVLTNFVDRWASFEQQVRSRGHPPLVDDMVRQLDVRSPVLQFNIFLCMCRRIPGAKVEGRLQQIFAQNLDNYKRRFVEPVSKDQQERENADIIAAYVSTIAESQEIASGPPTTGGPAAGPPCVASPAPGWLVSNQMVPAFVPVHATGPPPQNPPHPHAQPHSQARTTRSMALVSGPSVATPQSFPSAQLVTQRRDVMQQVPVPSSSPHMTVTAPPSAAPRGWHTYQSPHQPRVQSPRTVQTPHHPVPMPAGQRLPARPHAQSAAPRQPHRGSPSLLLPAPSAAQVLNTRPNPNRLALHQAHLRDPVNKVISRDAMGEKVTELLPYVTSFAVHPTPLGQTISKLQWKFTLSKAELECRPTLQAQGLGRRMLRTLMAGSQLYRLRCIKIAPSTTEVREHAWCVTETAWPCAVYVFINDVELTVRRKVHNGRDLPLDITPNLREGVNRLTVHVIRSPRKEGGITYAMAVEILTLRSFTQTKDLAQSLSAVESRERILRKLNLAPGDDDELRIVSDDLTVTLTDPFTARLFVVPVRGQHCQHVECFDHETFLRTRVLKSGDRSALEADWRCPICGQDARPQSLVVDGFMAEVRAEVERENRSAFARALQIRADGSWEVKTEEDLTPAERGTPKPQPSRELSKRKSNALENAPNPAPRRPKVDGSSSTPEGSSTPSAVIILD